MTAWRVLVAISILALTIVLIGGCGLIGGGGGDEGGGDAAAPPGASEGLPAPEGGAPGAPEAGAPPPGAPGTAAPEAGAEAAPAGGAEAPAPGAGAEAPAPGMGPEGPAPGGMGAPTAPSSGSAAKGLQLKHEGDYDAAANEFRGAMTADPNDEKAIWGLAWVLAEQGESDPAKRQEAKGLFEKFVGMSSDSAKVSEAKAALGRIG